MLYEEGGSIYRLAHSMIDDVQFQCQPGHILKVQSNQFCAVQKAECAVQDTEMCSPNYIHIYFELSHKLIPDKSYSFVTTHKSMSMSLSSCLTRPYSAKNVAHL